MTTDQLIASVEWTPAAPPAAPEPTGLPYATHTGVLDLMGHRIRVYRLNDGRAIVNAEDMNAFLFGLTKDIAL